MAETFTNKNPKTLASSLSSTATTFSLSDVTNLPTSGTGRCIIDSEIITVTYDGTTTPVIARGQEGTTAAIHSSSASVNFIISAGALNQFRADNFGIGVHSSRPAAGIAGRVWQDTDSATYSRDNGSSWDTFGLGGRPIVPPTLSNLSYNVGYAGATFGNTHILRQKGAILFGYYNSNNGGQHQTGAWLQTNPSPSSGYTATLGYEINAGSDANLFTGIAGYESSSGKICIFGIQSITTLSTGYQWFTVSGNGAGGPSTSFGGTSASENELMTDTPFIRIQYDPTYRTDGVSMFVSRDGIDFAYEQFVGFSSAGGVSNFDYIGAGFRLYTGISTNGGTGLNLYHWSRTSP